MGTASWISIGLDDETRRGDRVSPMENGSNNGKVKFPLDSTFSVVRTLQSRLRQCVRFGSTSLVSVVNKSDENQWNYLGNSACLRKGSYSGESRKI